VTATTSTTIQGVSVHSVHSRQKKRHADVFELGLSPGGIEVRRPGRPVQQMAWNRVSEWEIEERKGYVLLTLRGRGATTPLIVPGWSLDDLEVLMRDITSDAMTYVPEGPAPRFDGEDENENENENGAAAPTAGATTATPAAPTRTRRKSAPAPPKAAETVAAAVAAAAAAAVTPVAPPAPPTPTAPARQQPSPPAPSRAERRQTSKQRRTFGSFALPWKTVVAIALLGVVAAAVTIVLLQSAGVISWSFLGPVA
jgi:hypothetical protein